MTAAVINLPRALGVSRDDESPGGKGVLVAFDRALTDDELRALHDLLAHGPAAADAQAIEALRRIREAGNNTTDWATWAQKTAAWGMQTGYCPEQPVSAPEERPTAVGAGDLPMLWGHGHAAALQTIHQMRQMAGGDWVSTDADGETCLKRMPHWRGVFEFRTLVVLPRPAANGADDQNGGAA